MSLLEETDAPSDYTGVPFLPSGTERLGAGLAATFFGSAVSPWTVVFSLILVGAWLGLGVGALLGLAKQGRLTHGLLYAGLIWGLLAITLGLRGGFQESSDAFRRGGISHPTESPPPNP